MLPKKKRASTPRPGRPARGTRSGRPVMVLFDLLGRRWALRILWELRGSAGSFRELQARCGGLSPSVLNRRLAELRAVGLVEAGAGGYALAPAGRELLALWAPLNRWAEAWARRRR